MEKIEICFMIFESLFIVIEIIAIVYQIITNKKLEKKLLNELNKIEIENAILEKYL